MRTLTDRYINLFTDFGFKIFFEQAKIAQFSEQEYQEYENSLKYYRDLKNSMDTAFDDGKNEGIVQIATKMITRGDSDADISELTDLSVDEIKKLRLPLEGFRR